MRIRIKILFALILIAFAPTEQTFGDDVSFSRDILPLLSDRCFHCHGPDETHRESGLRLDLEDEAKGYAIVPKDLEGSEAWLRIISEDPDQQMPPPDSHRKPFTEAERDLIRRWILEGAPWGRHWAFEPPVKTELPKLATHPIDAFIRKRLKEEGLEPAPLASQHTQLRRLSFALTGLSPSPEEMREFLEGTSGSTVKGDVWQKMVDRKLQSPHYAERMAMWWLDAARYSDSDGYQIDATRENWPWRDWVVDAFAKNMPYDEFTIEQFAGDLLPDGSEEQVLATCFHRNHMTNGEGGRNPEESRIDYVIDRVNTTGTVWLGLTLGCTQCHSHKFDPISHQDYYSLAAFFNSIDETGAAGRGAKPYLNYTSPHAANQIERCQQFVDQCKQDELTSRQRAEARFNHWLETEVKKDSSGYRQWWTPTPTVSGLDDSKFSVEEGAIIRSLGPDLMHDEYRVAMVLPEDMTRLSGWRLEIFPDDSHHDGRFTRYGTGDFTLTGVRILLRRDNSPSEIELEHQAATASYEPAKDLKSNWDRRYANIAKTLNDDARDGWTSEGATLGEPLVGVYELREPYQLQPGDQVVVVLQQRSTHGHANVGRFRVSLATERGETVRRVDGGSPLGELYRGDAKTLGQIAPDLRKRLLSQSILDDHEYQASRTKLDLARKQLASLKNQAQPRAVMVLKDREKPRITHILERGVWDAKGEEVQTAVLPSVLAWPAEKARTRLDLAHWLVAPENPLPARVAVNHLWQIMFGQGLVATPEDFGLQGEFPSHPELLDWLAVELVEHDWDLQHILRLIATSETFRQSSFLKTELIERDPENRLLARAPRYRLPAWMLRDNALNVSGLLNRDVGGPPVFPYQPEGIWAEITMGRFHYQPTLGPQQYRRTLYAFWRRSSAPAFLFDSSQRRVCEVGLRRTNTPLHALTLMNDETYLEASRALADSVAKDLGVEINLNRLFDRVLNRHCTANELTRLSVLYHRSFGYFEAHPVDANKYTKVGQRPVVTAERLATTAAWMNVCNLILNLDESLSRE